MTSWASPLPRNSKVRNPKDIFLHGKQVSDTGAHSGLLCTFGCTHRCAFRLVEMRGIDQFDGTGRVNIRCVGGSGLSASGHRIAL
jgi:hypothetical protein